MSLAVLPHFAEEGGRIIHIGSIAAQTGSGSPGALGYAAAKAACMASAWPWRGNSVRAGSR